MFFRMTALALGLAAGLSAAHGIQPAHFDTSVKPCQDFFHYANGTWLKQNPIPADQNTWGAFNELRENNRAALKNIMEQAAAAKAPKGSAQQKVGDFYAAGMDEAAIEKAGLAPLKPYLTRIAAIKDAKNLAREIGLMHTEGAAPAFEGGVGQDDKDSSQYIAQFAQGGLSLPDRDYYTLDDAKSKELRTKYLTHLEAMFKLLGDEPAAAKANAEVVLKLETRLAKASMTRVELRDPNAIYHKMGPKELQKLSPDFPWASYFQAIGLKAQTAVLVRQPKFFEELGRMAKDVPMKEWKAYIRWHRLNAHTEELPDAFGRESFEFFGKALSGAKERQARWKRVQARVDGALGELVGQVYVEKAFSPQAKAKMIEMVDNLKAALRERIENLSWMSAPTKKLALQKLNAFAVKIGYPDKWRDYSKLDVLPGSYLANTVKAAKFEFTRAMAKLGQPIDRTEWDMTPQTVNAYYSPNMNEIVFPAGILQPPFFDVKADDACNYGGIGMVIGHEMTHGFDDEGRQFDHAGNLKDWWTPEDAKAYDSRSAMVVKQYDAFVALPGLNVNGKLTLGENIADLGGLKIAFEALKRQWAKSGKPAATDGFTPEQRFFLGYAQSWRFHGRDEAIRMRVMTDPHSPAIFRVNGPLANMPEFFEAFGCKDGDTLVRPADQRPTIW